MIERDTITTAKSVASVDHVSNGRLELGLGAGWYVPEHEQFGITLAPPGELVGRFHEAVQIVDTLLRHGRVSFAGKYYRLADAHIRPVATHTRAPRPRAATTAARTPGVIPRRRDRAVPSRSATTRRYATAV